MQAKLPDGFRLKGFKNPALIDNHGNIYKYDRSSQNGSDQVQGYYNMDKDALKDKKYSIAYIPSFYFTKKPASLIFLCDGYIISETKKQEFTVNMKEKFPQSFESMGKELIIRKASYENGKLNLVLVLPKPLCGIGHLALMDSTGKRFYYEEQYIPCAGGQEINYVISADKQSKYRIQMVDPLYFVEDTIKTDISLPE